jgi:hypothetical protein
MARREGFRGRLTRLSGRERIQTRSDIILLVALNDIAFDGVDLARFDAVMMRDIDELPPLGAAAYMAEIFAL